MRLANWGLSWLSFGFLSGQRSLGGEEPGQWSVQLNWSSWYFKSRKEFWKNWKMSQAWGEVECNPLEEGLAGIGGLGHSPHPGHSQLFGFFLLCNTGDGTQDLAHVRQPC